MALPINNNDPVVLVLKQIKELFNANNNNPYFTISSSNQDPTHFNLLMRQMPSDSSIDDIIKVMEFLKNKQKIDVVIYKPVSADNSFTITKVY